MSAHTATAFWITQPEQGELREETLPTLAPGQVMVRTLFSGISRGTEALVWHGRVPASQYQRMRAPFQQGDFPGPVKYGYANVGRVEAGPEDWVGQRVFCLYPHQTRYCVPVQGVFALPEALPTENAILAANVETALNGCWDAAPQIGERIAVIGAGVVGSLVAALCAALPGTEVELIDINPGRADLAKALGVAFATPDQAQGEVDCVIHASASADGLNAGLALAGMQARVIEMSWYGDQHVPVALGEDFHSHRLTLRSSQVGQIHPMLAPRWDTARRMRKALALIAQNPQWAALIDAESAFSQLPITMPAIAQGQGLCHRIRYSE